MNDDLISRQAAIDAAKKLLDYYGSNDISKEFADHTAEQFMNRVPSAQPEQNKGKWIKLDMHAHLADHKCTACGQECYVPTCMGEPMYTYCPYCGAKMDEEEE